MLIALALCAMPSAHAARPASAGYADSDNHPIRCHWSQVGDEGICQDVLGYADIAWDVQVDHIGFRPPVPDAGVGGSDALDIYLTIAETGSAGSAWVDCEAGDGHCVDSDPNDGVAGTPAYVLIDARTEDLHHYTQHEFSHVLQYATDFDEQSIVLWESTAVSAEHWTDPLWTTSAADLADFQATPWISTVLQDGYFLDDEYGIWSYYEYGSALWMRWLDVTHGDGTGMFAALMWEAAAQEGPGREPDVLDAWDELTGDWRDDLVAFTAFRGMVGTALAPEWIEWAGEGGRAWREAELERGEAATPMHPPYPLGVAYYDVRVGPSERVTASLDGADSTLWRLIGIDGAGDYVDDAETVSINADDDGLATFAVVNLGSAGLDADDALTADTFTLTVADDMVVVTEPDCGCSTTPGVSSGLGLAAGLLFVRRRASKISAVRRPLPLLPPG